MEYVIRRTLLFVFVLALGSTASGQTPPQTNAPAAPPKKNERPAGAEAHPPGEPYDSASVERMATACVRLETEAGVIEIEMLPGAAPETVRNFLNLVAIGAFDTTTFSRTVKDFVVQGGSLYTSQKLTPELARRATRKLKDEPSDYVKHLRGIVSMARSDEPNSATTSFFILVGDAPHLDGKFAAFGRVRSGMEVVDAINHAPADGEKPEKPVRLARALIFDCPPQTPTPP